MRIAIIADPFLPVPPLLYGGIERIVDFLVTGLAARGHAVKLVAHSSSSANVPLLPYRESESVLKGHIQNIRTISGLYKFEPQVIHSFARLIYLLPFLRSEVPKVMSYQREPTLAQIRKVSIISRKGSICFTGCSDYITRQIQPVALASTVYNGVDMSKYDFNSLTGPNAPLVFLGRIEPIKGVKTAILAAKAAGKELIIAGNIPPEYQDYFQQEIVPSLNNHITYIGPVNDKEKNKLLGQSSALLMPINWNEPFGIVMAEAMACGTPVIGFNKGAVPEIIEHGVNGYLCNELEDMVKLIASIDRIDRGLVRENAEKRFSSETIIDEYIKVYQNLTQRF